MQPTYPITDLSHCALCPRGCGADRAGGAAGFCGVPAALYVARAALHFWEEPCISGDAQAGTGRGSGAVFFSGCPLRCVYCQNYDVARAAFGVPITTERLSDIFLELQAQGAHNINLVTPTQYIPQIAAAARRARQNGLTLPFVCNCGGYEKPEALQLLEGIVDMYLTDFKYMDSDLARRYSAAADYPQVARAALAEMVRQCPAPVFAKNGLMTRGVIVRHLVLPGHVKNAKAVVHYVYETYGDAVWLSLMNQYTPSERVKRAFPELGRKVTRREYAAVLDDALALGVTNAFFQEGGAAKESFIPAFDGCGVRRK